MNGKTVRENYPQGTLVRFKPKCLIEGEPMIGLVVGHIYVSVLIVETIEHRWFISVTRCEKI